VRYWLITGQCKIGRKIIIIGPIPVLCNYLHFVIICNCESSCNTQLTYQVTYDKLQFTRLRLNLGLGLRLGSSESKK